MKESYIHIIKIGYCDAQNLLQYENETAYSTCTEGWACDYYIIDNVLISTGYAPLESKNTKVNYDTIKKYDNAARGIVHNYNLPYEEREKQVKKLLSDFVDEAKANQ